MHGLLALVWLSPKHPNAIDRLFGRFADRQQTYENQLDIALLMLAVMLVALLWRSLRNRPQALTALAPELNRKLADPKTLSWANRAVTAALLVVALVSSVNYFYGTRNNGIYAHRWDAFHTIIGAKYHAELGYFGLYKCAYAIDREGPHHFRSVESIRDLDTRKFVPRAKHIAGNHCKERFTPERLEQFKHDLDEFGTWSNKRTWRRLFKDKGFNGTPFYTTVVKGLLAPVDVNLQNLQRLAAIDPILMLIGFGFVGWAFGARRAAILAIFFCVFFPNRFTHMGGSILRFDYVACLLIGFSAIKKDKWGLAGGMFAWATMVRVFPAVFAVGVGLKIVSDVIRDKKILEQHWRFVGFFVGGLLLFFIISLIGMDGGFENWRTWKANMDVHNSKSASFRVGFKHLFMADGKLTSNAYGTKQANFVARQDYYWVAVVALLAPLLTSIRRLDTISFATMFGVFTFFLLVVATRYYYGIVALLFLIDRRPLGNRFMLMMGAMLFLATAIDFAYFELNDSDSFMYNLVIGVELSVVIVALGSWLLLNPSLVDVGDDPRLPTHVPAHEPADRSVLGTLDAVPAELPAVAAKNKPKNEPKNKNDQQKQAKNNPKDQPAEALTKEPAAEPKADAPSVEAGDDDEPKA